MPPSSTARPSTASSTAVVVGVGAEDVDVEVAVEQVAEQDQRARRATTRRDRRRPAGRRTPASVASGQGRVDRVRRRRRAEGLGRALAVAATAGRAAGRRWRPRRRPRRRLDAARPSASARVDGAGDLDQQVARVPRVGSGGTAPCCTTRSRASPAMNSTASSDGERSAERAAPAGRRRRRSRSPRTATTRRSRRGSRRSRAAVTIAERALGAAEQLGQRVAGVVLARRVEARAPASRRRAPPRRPSTWSRVMPLRNTWIPPALVAIVPPTVAESRAARSTP